MINILHSIDTSGPGGAETVYFNILVGLDRTRFRSLPVISAKGWLYDRLREQELDPVIIDAHGSFNLSYLWQLIRIIRKKNIDLIHSHLFGSNVYCCLAGLLTSTPVISTFHGFVDIADTGKATRAKIAVINKGAKKIVFVSQQLKKCFTENFSITPSLTEVIYNGVDTEKFKPGKNHRLKKKISLENDSILVGSIGNIRPAKNYDLLLRAAAEVKKQRQDIKFVIAGQGSGELYQKLLNLQDRLDLKDTVFFLGFKEDTLQVLHGIDIFLLCSTSEGFSISLIEAMACGLPVIATKCGGPEEIISSGQEGILLEEQSPLSMANSILALSISSIRRKNFEEHALSCVTQRFNNSTVISRYSELYETIVGSPSHG